MSQDDLFLVLLRGEDLLVFHRRVLFFDNLILRRAREKARRAGRGGVGIRRGDEFRPSRGA